MDIHGIFFCPGYPLPVRIDRSRVVGLGVAHHGGGADVGDVGSARGQGLHGAPSLRRSMRHG